MPEDIPDPRSAMAASSSNKFEVEMVAGLVEYLINSNEYNLKDITVLTPYNGQLAAFTERLAGTCSIWLSEKDRMALFEEGLLKEQDDLPGMVSNVAVSDVLKLATIDNFQGEESKVVILSTVRSNIDGRVGFLKASNRINVACSRARDGFYIVGNSSLMRTVEMWAQIVDEMTAKLRIGSAFHACCPRHPQPIHEVRKPVQWTKLPKCKKFCGAVLPCGHTCHWECHAESLHERKGCPEPCPRFHEKCGHNCLKTCGQPCGDCTFPLNPIKLACGHLATPTCTENIEATEIICAQQLSPVQLLCGHEYRPTCSTQSESPECTEKCGQILECGHRCQSECQRCTSRRGHAKCSSPCERELDCGHLCGAPCHKGQCPPCQQACLKSCRHGQCSRKCGQSCDPCVQPCDWTCNHHGLCTDICCLPCNRLPCSEPCLETLSCGHLCPSLCSEDCPTKCPQCQTGRMPSKTIIALGCGHNFPLEYLDSFFGTSNVYQVSSTGYIQAVCLKSIQQLPLIDLYCPECGMTCKDVRRYAIYNQLSQLEHNLDRMYARLCRRMNTLLGEILRKRLELDRTTLAYTNMLRIGPLTGKANENLTRDRGSKLAIVQTEIVAFKGTRYSLWAESKADRI